MRWIGKIAAGTLVVVATLFLLWFLVVFVGGTASEFRSRIDKSTTPTSDEVQITVWGSERMGFIGSYGNTAGIRSVEGWTPQKFHSKARGAVSATFQKSTGHSGTLRVKIWRGDDLLAEQETTAQHGVVTMAVQVP